MCTNQAGPAIVTVRYWHGVPYRPEVKLRAFLHVYATSCPVAVKPSGSISACPWWPVTPSVLCLPLHRRRRRGLCVDLTNKPPPAPVERVI